MNYKNKQFIADEQWKKGWIMAKVVQFTRSQDGQACKVIAGNRRFPVPEKSASCTRMV
jgi:hypothetical protein